MLKIISKSEQNLLRVQVDFNFMWCFQVFPQYVISWQFGIQINYIDL